MNTNESNEIKNQDHPSGEQPDRKRVIIHNLHRARTSVKWILIAILTGLLVAGVGIAFSGISSAQSGGQPI